MMEARFGAMSTWIRESLERTRAVAVSPAEVSEHVLGGKLKILAVMADERLRRELATAN